MFEFLFNKAHKSKESIILSILQKNINKDVSALYLVKKANTLHHTALIKRLRDQWYDIINTCKWENWVKHSFYKLID